MKSNKKKIRKITNTNRKKWLIIMYIIVPLLVILLSRTLDNTNVGQQFNTDPGNKKYELNLPAKENNNENFK